MSSLEIGHLLAGPTPPFFPLWDLNGVENSDSPWESQPSCPIRRHPFCLIGRQEGVEHGAPASRRAYSPHRGFQSQLKIERFFRYFYIISLSKQINNQQEKVHFFLPVQVQGRDGWVHCQGVEGMCSTEACGGGPQSHYP